MPEPTRMTASEMELDAAAPGTRWTAPEASPATCDEPVPEKSLKEDLRRIGQSVSHTASASWERGRQGAAHVAHAARRGAAAAGGAVREGAARTGRATSATLAGMQDEIVARPWASLAVAFGVGLVIGKLIDVAVSRRTR